jgi:phosphatidylglycerophosphate synthase
MSSSTSCRERFTHPVDALIVRYSHEVVTLLRQGLRLTPNMVTLLSFLAALLALWMLHRRQLVGFVALALLSYYFDVLDGNMARRYRIFSRYGEAFDHLSDAAFFVGIVAVLAFSYGGLRKPLLLGLYALTALVPAVQYAAAQRACGSDEGVIGFVAKIFVPADKEAAGKLGSAMLLLGGPSYQLVMILGAVALALLLDAPRRPPGRSRSRRMAGPWFRRNWASRNP